MSASDSSARARLAVDAAVEADHAAVLAEMAGFPGAELRTDDGAQELLTGLAAGFFNNTVLVRWGSDVDARLDAVVERARQRGAPWRFYVTDATTPSTLEAALASAGLVQGHPGRSMLHPEPRTVRTPVVDGLSIERVTNMAGLERWVGVRVETNDWAADAADAWRQAQSYLAFSREEPMHYWTGALHGDTVAIVVLHMGAEGPDGSRDAGIYHVETVPRARRRGIATAMTAHAVEAAVRLGATRIVLSATQAAESAYARLGFRRAGSFTFWFDRVLGA